MPWPSGSAFGGKHWKKATPGQASDARKRAEAMMAKGVPEGIAIPTAISDAKKASRGQIAKAGKGKKRKAKRKGAFDLVRGE